LSSFDLDGTQDNALVKTAQYNITNHQLFKDAKKLQLVTTNFNDSYQPINEPFYFNHNKAI